MSTTLKFEIERCQKVFNTGIVGTDDTLALSALIEILIRLDYILKELTELGKRVSFTDDVRTGDISDLVNNMRNAACHSDSARNKIENATLIYNVFNGYCPNAIVIEGVTLGCNYQDDTAINFGGEVIYLERHIHRLLKELPVIISSI